jgi:hypothetical protein
MKKTLSTLLLTCFVTIGSVSANSNNNYVCKESYETKLEKIEKNRTIRNIGKYSFVGGLLVGSAFVPFLFLATDMATLSTILVVPTVTGGASSLMDVVDREKGLIQATKFYEISQVDRKSLKVKYYDKYISSMHYRANLNSEIKVTRDQVIETYPIDTFELKSIVDIALDAVNKKRNRKSLQNLSYEEFQNEIAILLNTNLFCEKRAITYRKLVKVLKKELAR